MDLIISQLADKSYQKQVLQCIEINDEVTINEVVAAIKKIMKDKYPPLQCLHGLKLVKDGIELFKSQFREVVRQQLIEQIYQVATYRIRDQDDSRGASYFSNPEQEKSVNQYGASYVRMAIDCICVWGKWFSEFKVYEQRLISEDGYIPPLAYFKQDLVNQHIQKDQPIKQQQQITPTPDGDQKGETQRKAEELHEQAITLLYNNQRDNDQIKNELAIINSQIEDILLQDIQNPFVDDYAITFPEYENGNISYIDFRNQFLTNHPLKQQQQQQQVQQQSKIIQQSQIQQSSQLKQQQSQIKDEQNHKIYELNQIIQQQISQIQDLTNNVKSLEQELQKKNDIIHQQYEQMQHQELNVQSKQEVEHRHSQLLLEIENLKSVIRTLEDQIQKQEQKLQKKRNKKKILKTQLVDIQNKQQEQDKNNNQDDLRYLTQQQQQQIEKLEHQLNYTNNEKQINNSNQIEEIENLKIEKNQLLDKLKNYELQNQSQPCNQQDYSNLKEKYDLLDSKYYLLKQENYKLKQANNNIQNQSQNQSRMINSSNSNTVNREENGNIIFQNFKDADLWTMVGSQQLGKSTIKQVKDISELIYPHKTAADYYKVNGKKQFRGNLIPRSIWTLNQLNQNNIQNLKKASLNQISILYQSDKIEIKSRQQLILGQNKQEYISTTLSLKNKDLRQLQLQITQLNKNIWINKELKSVLLQAQQSILYEFVREANVKNHDITSFEITINFNPLNLYLPNFLLNCLKFTILDSENYRQYKKQFTSQIYKTNICQIGQKDELLLLTQQGALLNEWESENDEQIIESKYGFKACLSKQFEFYLELIITPCDEFLFKGFTQYDEETLQFVLNGLVNLYCK